MRLCFFIAIILSCIFYPIYTYDAHFVQMSRPHCARNYDPVRETYTTQISDRFHLTIRRNAPRRLSPPRRKRSCRCAQNNDVSLKSPPKSVVIPEDAGLLSAPEIIKKYGCTKKQARSIQKSYIERQSKKRVERDKKLATEREKKRKYEESIKQTVKKKINHLSDDDFFDCVPEFDVPENMQRRWDDRARAIECTQNTNYQLTHCQYELSDQATAFLRDQKLEPVCFTFCQGTAIQQQLHQETVDIVEKAAQLNSRYKTHMLARNFTQSAAAYADIVQQYNQAGRVAKAALVTDLCWAFLEQNLYIACDGLFAVGEGVCRGAKNTAHAVLHPVNTVKNMALGVGLVGYCLGRVLYEVCDMTIACRTNLYRAEEKLYTWCNAAIELERAVEKKIQETSVRDVIKGAATLSADIFLMGKCLKVAGKIMSVAKVNAVNILRKAKEGLARAPELVAMTAEGIPVGIAQKTAHFIEGAGEKVGKAGAFVKKGLDFSKLHSSIGDFEKLREAEVLLKDTVRGASKLFKIITENGLKTSGKGNLGTARGAAFELERAVDLIKKLGKKIVNMGKKVKNRDFDIETLDSLIECKNIDWFKKAGKLADEMKSTFGDQARIAKDYGKIFEVHSKTPISQAWKQWFTKKGINFIEGLL